MPQHEDAPGKVEAIAAAIAGPAFAGSAILLREATLLPAALFDAAAALLVAIGLAPLAHRLLGAMSATLLRGAGLVAAVLLGAAALVPPFDRAAPPLALAIAGGALLQAGARERRLVASTLGLLAVSAGWGLAFAIAPALPEPGRLRFALLVAAPLILTGLAVRALLVRRGHTAFAPMPVGVLLVVALGTIYLGYRPLVATQVANLPLYEWSLGVMGASLLLSRLRRHARERQTPEAWSSDARRHAQDVAPKYDDRMVPLAAAIQRYLDEGEGFEAYLAALRKAAPHAPRDFEARLRALRSQDGRARSPGSEARLAQHRELMALLSHPHPNEVSDGISQPRLRSHP